MPNTLSHITWLTQSEILGSKYSTYFDSIDSLFIDITGSGGVDLYPGYVEISGGSFFGYSLLSKRINYPFVSLDFNKKTTLKLRAYFEFQPGGSNDNFISRGNFSPWSKTFGFRFKNDGLYGYCGNYLNSEEIKLIHKGPGFWSDTWNLEAILIPGLRVSFFVNNVFRGMLTNHAPSGPPLTNEMWCILVSIGGEAANILQLSELHLFFD